MAHDWSVLERDLRRCLPPRAIVAKRQELLSYDCDGLTLERHCPPLAVLPETTEQVAAVLQCCHQHGVPFVARGSGTGLSGGALVDQQALLVVTSRMLLQVTGFITPRIPPARWFAASAAMWRKIRAGCTASNTA